MFKISLIITLLFVKESFQGFQKDLNVNIQFPPILDRREGIPTGHLRPLGWQNRPEGPVVEESVMIDPEKFWDSFIRKDTPVVLRGLVIGSDAAEHWTDSHLNKEYGHLDIKLAESIQTYVNHNERTQMKLTKFLEGYRLDDWYLNGIMPDDMQSEAPVPRLLNCGPFVFSEKVKNSNYQRAKENIMMSLNGSLNSNFEIPSLVQLVEPYFWLSAGETSSLLHSHPEHNLHCVLDGRKDFILIPSDQFSKPDGPKLDKKKGDWRKQLDLVESYPKSNEWYSKINVDKVSAYKYSILESIVWYYASLRSGDCIYIPANYLHQVRSHGRSASSSIYFKTLKLKSSDEKIYDEIKREMFRHCSSNAPLFESMNSISRSFLWVYTHSERHLNKRDFKNDDVKYYLQYMIKNVSLHYENFENFYNEITGELKKKLSELKIQIRNLLSLSASDIWNEFTKEKSLTIEQIQDIPDSVLIKLKQIFNIVANYHGSESSYKAKSDEL